MVEHGDPVGELVGLVQVLRGEEDRHAAGDQLADDLPHRAPAARVEPGGRLVEEDDPRVADQRHGQVEPAPHAAGVGRGGLLRRVREVEPVEQLGGAAPALGPAQVVQVRHQEQVLLAGEQVVHRGELAGDPDRGRAPRRAPRPGRARRPATSPASARISVDRICTAVVLPAPLGPSREKTVPGGDGQVDAVEHHLVAERPCAAPWPRSRVRSMSVMPQSLRQGGFSAVSTRFQRPGTARPSNSRDVRRGPVPTNSSGHSGDT